MQHLLTFNYSHSCYIIVCFHSKSTSLFIFVVCICLLETFSDFVVCPTVNGLSRVFVLSVEKPSNKLMIIVTIVVIMKFFLCQNYHDVSLKQDF